MVTVVIGCNNDFMLFLIFAGVDIWYRNLIVDYARLWHIIKEKILLPHYSKAAEKYYKEWTVRKGHRQWIKPIYFNIISHILDGILIQNNQELY